jgi:urease accessory protein UreF
MTFTIKSGVLAIGRKRIVLAHVITWDDDGRTFVLTHTSGRESLAMGADGAKLATALDEWFSQPDQKTNALQKALSFAASCIKSGEPWSNVCEDMIGGALKL